MNTPACPPRADAVDPDIAIDMAVDLDADSAAIHAPRWWAAAAVLLGAGVLLHNVPANHGLMLALHAQAGLPAGLWSALTLLGFGWPIVILACALDRRSSRTTALLLHTLWIAALLTHLPKLLVGSPRPASVLPAGTLQVIGEPIHRIGSLPSGHALAATAALCLLWFSRPLWRQQGRALFVPLALLAAAVAWSRVAVGAHWPADVLAGAGLGLAAGLLALRAEQAWPLARPLGTVPGQRWVAALELGAGAAWLMTHSGYPLANTLQGGIAAIAFTSGLWRWRCAVTADRGDAAPASVALPSRVAL